MHLQIIVQIVLHHSLCYSNIYEENMWLNWH